MLNIGVCTCITYFIKIFINSRDGSNCPYGKSALLILYVNMTF